MIKELNSRSIIPDLITFKSHVDPNLIEKMYGEKIEFNIREIFFNVKLPYEWNLVFFNRMTRFYTGKYDLLINSNNTSLKAPKKIPTITYVHFPRKARVLSRFKSTHFEDGDEKGFWDLSMDPFFAIRSLYKNHKRFGNNETLLANSFYTASVVKNFFDIEEEIKVLYPPVVSETKSSDSDKIKQVASLGRFSPEKRQLEQIRIASSLPEIKFKIMGFVESKLYFEQCQKLVNDLGISNVDLLPNLEFVQVESILDKSRYFLHSVRNEPFGITTVQAIEHGCIPIVHDSGGQKEIVEKPQLLYSNEADAIKTIQDIIALPVEQLNILSTFLMNKLVLFSKESFRNEFKTILDHQIG